MINISKRVITKVHIFIELLEEKNATNKPSQPIGRPGNIGIKVPINPTISKIKDRIIKEIDIILYYTTKL
jgi:hypothetical protein